MLTLKTLFVVLAAICLFLAAISISVPRVHLGWAGMFLWLVSEAIP